MAFDRFDLIDLLVISKVGLTNLGQEIRSQNATVHYGSAFRSKQNGTGKQRHNFGQRIANFH